MDNTKLILLALLFLLFSCSDDDSLPVIAACGVSNPVEDLDWLGNSIRELQSNDSEVSQFFFVSQAIFEGETVFIFNNCCPFCNTVATVHSCDGTVLGFLNNEIPEIDITESTIVYRPDGFGCTLN